MTLHDLLLNKNWLKVLSLVMAALIYLVIQTNVSPIGIRLANPLHPTETREFRVPVIVVTAATNRRLFDIQPAQARVTVRGDASSMDKLIAGDVQVMVSLVEVTEAEGTFRLEAKVPPEINAQEIVIFPASVRVKTLPIAGPGQPAPEAPR